MTQWQVAMEILLDENAIAARVRELGREIAGFYRGRPLTLVILANGALVFGADLARAIGIPLQWDVLSVGSYARDRSTGELNFRSLLKLNPSGRHILLVDEILDTGLTLEAVRRKLLADGAADVRTVVMVEKSRRRPGGLKHPDWRGVELPDRYLVGYGLDSEENYRNLPYIAALD